MDKLCISMLAIAMVVAACQAALSYELHTEVRLLSRDKSATQSSTEDGGDANRATDGIKSVSENGNSCSLTAAADTVPWWQVDLGRDYLVYSVHIHLRDVYSHSSSHQHLRVHSRSEVGKQEYELCKPSVPEHASHPGLVRFTCNRSARYIRVEKPGEHLSICEAEVFGVYSEPEEIPASEMRTYQSTTRKNGDSYKAIDGNTNQYAGNGSCTRTKWELGPWWAVDLGAVYSIDRVMIYNQAKHGMYLGPFLVLLGETAAKLKEVTRKKARGTDHEILVIPISRTGRYLRINDLDNSAVAVCEIKFYGTRILEAE